eukprot:5967518-Pyramimonas_sp.AAC.1
MAELRHVLKVFHSDESCDLSNASMSWTMSALKRSCSSTGKLTLKSIIAFAIDTPSNLLTCETRARRRSVGLDTDNDTVQSTVKTLSSRLVTRKISSPADALQTSHVRVEPCRSATPGLRRLSISPTIGERLSARKSRGQTFVNFPPDLRVRDLISSSDLRLAMIVDTDPL